MEVVTTSGQCDMEPSLLLGGSGHKKMYIYFTVHWEIHIVQQENLVVHPKKDIFGRYIDVFAWYSSSQGDRFL